MNKKELAARRIAPHHDSNREPYMRDKARILHSAFFRRLQSKKQIHDLDISDFGRTRLTHTLEVAQIATGIREILKQEKSTEIKELLPNIFGIEASALAHDLGHPPNGHGGEIALNYLMQENGGFEGNAQSFRITATLGEYESGFGLNLTRATMLGLLKYPVLYSKVANNQKNSTQEATGKFPKFSNYIPPKCIFDSEKEILDWMLEPFIKEDREKYCQIDKKTGKAKHFNFFSSIVDLADDIAYGVHDLEDAIALKLVSIKDLEEQEKELSFEGLKIEYQKMTQNLFSSKDRKMTISKIVNLFISNVKLEKKHLFESNILDYNVILPENLKVSLKNLKNFIEKKVILRRENQLMEFKLQNIIVELFQCLCSDAERFLPEKYCESIQKKEDSTKRVVCDYIAGMTDRYLIKLHRTLFSPEYGSIFDKL